MEITINCYISFLQLFTSQHVISRRRKNHREGGSQELVANKAAAEKLQYYRIEATKEVCGKPPHSAAIPHYLASTSLRKLIYTDGLYELYNTWYIFSTILSHQYYISLFRCASCYWRRCNCYANKYKQIDWFQTLKMLWTPCMEPEKKNEE